MTHSGSNVFRIKYPWFFYEHRKTYICVSLGRSPGGVSRPDFQRCMFYDVVKSDTRVKAYMKDIRHQLYAWRSLLLRVCRPKVASSPLPILSHPRHLICTSAKWAWPRVHARFTRLMQRDTRNLFPLPRNSFGFEISAYSAALASYWNAFFSQSKGEHPRTPRKQRVSILVNHSCFVTRLRMLFTQIYNLVDSTKEIETNCTDSFYSLNVFLYSSILRAFLSFKFPVDV